RNISTLMPVAPSNSLAIFCACSIGVEVYQTTLPSFFAAARSTSEASAACASTRFNAQTVASARMRERRPIMPSLGSTCLSAIDRCGLREEAPEDVIDHEVVLLLEGRVGDAGHHYELLVGVWQALKEAHQIVEAGNAIPLTAHDDGRHHDPARV